MMRTRVFVVGHRGMLGHVVAAVLAAAGFAVHTTDARDDGGPDSPLIRDVVASGCDAVVNCAGTVPGRASPSELLATNALLPQRLAARLGPAQTLVHASSDGVFAGTRGQYRVDERPDATDPYGLSKRLGELCAGAGRAVVLRCSVIGPERGTERGLVAWLLAQRGEVPGYVDRRWNGITTLEWARLCRLAIQHELRPGIHQPACASPVTKCELLELIARTQDHEVVVVPTESGRPEDRTLVATLSCPPIAEQLQELRGWALGS